MNLVRTGRCNEFRVATVGRKMENLYDDMMKTHNRE